MLPNTALDFHNQRGDGSIHNIFWMSHSFEVSEGDRAHAPPLPCSRGAWCYCLDRELKGREEIIGGIFQSPWNADVNFDVN